MGIDHCSSVTEGAVLALGACAHIPDTASSLSIEGGSVQQISHPLGVGWDETRVGSGGGVVGEGGK